MKVADKVIVLTGAGSGMGRELALQLLARGARVAAVDINEASLAETASKAPDATRIATFRLDITDRALVAALPAQVIERFGAVDGLINCAGIIQPFVRLADLDDKAIDRVMGVNFYGTLYLTRAFLPHLLARPQGHVVNVSSMGGFLPVPGQTIYGAAKAAVKLMTEGLASELADTNVRVTVVFPGAIATNIAANSGVRIQADPSQSEHPTTSAQDAAGIILDAMERDAFRVTVGRDAWMLDLFYRATPQRAARFIQRQMKNLLAS